MHVYSNEIECTKKELASSKKKNCYPNCQFQILEALAKYHSCSPFFTAEERKPLSYAVVTGLFGALLQQTVILDNYIVNSIQYTVSSLDLLTKFLGKDGQDTLRKLKRGTEILSTPENMKKMDNIAEILGKTKNNITMKNRNGTSALSR